VAGISDGGTMTVNGILAFAVGVAIGVVALSGQLVP
jgi:hypothetical protein